MTTFTNDEYLLIGEFLRTETKDLAEIDKLVIDLTRLRNGLEVEDGLYAKMQQDAMDKQDALLQAKRTELDTADIDDLHIYSLLYLSGHPSLGGTDTTQWRISHTEDPDVIIDFIHADATPALIATDVQWAVFHDWRTNQLYGTIERLVNVASVVADFIQKRARIITRNQYLRMVN